MGKCVYLNLEIVGDEKQMLSALACLDSVARDDGWFCVSFSNSGAQIISDTEKWQELEEEIKTLSKQYPNMLFTLSADQGEFDESRVSCYKSGEMESDEETKNEGEFRYAQG